MGNKNRALYMLFDTPHCDVEDFWHRNSSMITRGGYFLIYEHRFPNDEPPYTMVTYWGLGPYGSEIYPEDGDSLKYWLIRRKDARDFIALMNERQTDYCDYMLEGNYTRAAGEHNLTMKEYADGAIGRPPRTKYMFELPHILSSLL